MKGEEELIVIHIYGVLIMLYFCLNVVMYLILNLWSTLFSPHYRWNKCVPVRFRQFPSLLSGLNPDSWAVEPTWSVSQMIIFYWGYKYARIVIIQFHHYPDRGKKWGHLPMYLYLYILNFVKGHQSLPLGVKEGFT